jgi:predicted transcriptional regulator of viral defense system
MKYLSSFRAQFKKSVTFATQDVLIFLGKQGAKKGYVYLLLHNLVTKGEIQRITKNTYTYREESMVVGFAFQPFYYGLQEALSIHGLWEQETIPVVLTLKKARPGTRDFLGNNYLLKRLSRKMFFGITMKKYYDIWIPVSDIEKTFLDLTYFKEPISNQVLSEIKKNLDKRKLDKYLKNMPGWVRKRCIKLLDNR